MAAAASATGVSVDAIHGCLRALRHLRCSVSQVFELLADGLKNYNGEETREKLFVLELQMALQTVNSYLREYETCSNNLGVPSGPLSLGNSSLLSQDPAQDRASLYIQMIHSYKWADKVKEFATHAAVLLGQNPMKRSNLIAKRTRKSPPNSHNVPLQTVDTMVAMLGRVFQDMQVHLSRPNGSSSVLEITLGKTLKAVVVLRSLIIEWVVVKAFNEELQTEDGKVDIWSSSRYKVFQKVTDHANAAMLHYSSPLVPDLAIKSFMMWLRSYNNLFMVPCHRCGQHLKDKLPPTWRDFRTLEPFHECCRS